MDERMLKERSGAFKKAYETYRNDIPAMRKAIEEEFRRLLGVEN